MSPEKEEIPREIKSYILLLVEQYNSEYIRYSQFLAVESITQGVIVIVVGNGHGDTSSNPGRD